MVLALFETGVDKDNDKGNNTGVHGWTSVTVPLEWS